MELAETIQSLMIGRSDLNEQSFKSGGISGSVFYLRGAIHLDMLQTHVFGPLSERDYGDDHTREMRLASLFDDCSLFSTPYSITDSVENAVNALLHGQVLLTVDGQSRMAVFPLANHAMRSVTVPQNEKTIRGPKDAFVEDLYTNLALIRQRIRSTELKVESFVLGVHSKTEVLLLYFEGKCKPEMVEQIRSRLGGIQLDHMNSSSVIEEYLDTNKLSPFPQMLYTERPDAAVASLIEGKVVILTDGTPNHLIVPAPLVAFLQAAEDYYQRFFFSSWIRLIRYLFFAVSLILPSTYVAITTFHPEMIPVSLLISIASSRDLVPFPAVFEAFAMELTFEVLREAGQRIPTAIGTTISIVGALVIGEAAVQAGIVSAPMVIVVSLTGISSFIIPHFELNLAIRFLRFLLLLLAGMFGLLGVLIGVILILIHLLALEPFGVPYLSPIAPLDGRKLRDVFVRLPWPVMWSSKKKEQGDHNSS